MKNIAYHDLGLKALKKTFKDSTAHVRVGVLGSKKNTRKNTELTNASIGLKHEFGDSNVPMRSFLRMPISEKLNSFFTSKGVFNKDTIKKIISRKDLLMFWKRVGQISEEIVGEAFDSGGFGKWPKLDDDTIKAKERSRVKGFKGDRDTGSGQILKWTQGLERSISSKVEKK